MSLQGVLVRNKRKRSRYKGKVKNLARKQWGEEGGDLGILRQKKTKTASRTTPDDKIKINDGVVCLGVVCKLVAA